MLNHNIPRLRHAEQAMTNVVNLTSHVGKHDPLNILKALTYMEAQTPHYQRSDYLETRRLGGGWGRGGQCSHWNEIWRTRIIEFFYRFIDNHPANLSREIVFLSSSIADRYLAKMTIDAEFDQEQSKSFYQLVTLASLYLGIKAFRHRLVAAGSPEIASQEEFLREDNDVVTIQSLLRSNTSGIQADDMRAMTRSILTTLSWQIRPISPLLFAKYIVCATMASTKPTFTVPSGTKRRRHLTTSSSNTGIDSTTAIGADRTSSSDDIRRQRLHSEMYDRSRFLCELSVCDYYFISYASSTVALASVFVAMDQMNLSNQEVQDYDELLQNVLSWTRMDQHLTEIAHLKKRLHQIYERSSETLANHQHNRARLIDEVDVVDDNDDSDADRSYLEVEARRKFRRVISSENLLSLSTLN